MIDIIDKVKLVQKSISLEKVVVNYEIEKVEPMNTYNIMYEIRVYINIGMLSVQNCTELATG